VFTHPTIRYVYILGEKAARADSKQMKAKCIALICVFAL